MFKKLLGVQFIFIFVFLCSPTLFSQSSSYSNTGAAEYSDSSSKLGKVVLAGLGGAVLGLSTLSFYGEPQKHLENILYGFGLGLATGSVYVLSQGDDGGVRVGFNFEF